MLTDDIRNALKGYTAGMQKDVALVLQAGEHEQREELTTFLNDIASVSPRITVEQRDFSGGLRSPLSFTLEADGRPTGIVFEMYPRSASGGGFYPPASVITRETSRNRTAASPHTCSR